ncbi:5721_t:CDS:2 [Entrophospora sp. SA101]|nr:5721_t:CDS:2 [Entrophospora sp. SA101]
MIICGIKIAPFLSIAEDLLKALKEGIIGKNSGNGTRKNDKCAKTFGKFSNAELSIQKPECFR